MPENSLNKWVVVMEHLPEITLLQTPHRFGSRCQFPHGSLDTDNTVVILARWIYAQARTIVTLGINYLQQLDIANLNLW